MPVGTNWVVKTIAGDYNNPGGLDGTNTAASFLLPDGIAIDSDGNLYVADNYNNTIRYIRPSGTNWIVTTIGGSATNAAGFGDGTNNVARFKQPWGIVADSSGNLFVTDWGNNTIRRGTLAAAVPAPVIGTVWRSGGNISFTWSAVTGRTYQVVYRTNLAQTVWSNLGSTVLATNSSMTTSDATSPGPRRFYRVALLP